MKRSTYLAMMMTTGFVVPSLGATVAPPAPPAEPPLIVVKLTASEIAVIRTAMEVAAGQCAVLPDGCVIGLQKQSVNAKFNDALVSAVKK